MELSRYLTIIKRRKWTIIFTIFVFTIIFTITSLLIPHNFTATAIINIDFARLGTPSYTELIYIDRIMNTYVEIATSSQIMSELHQTLGLDAEYPLEVKVEIIPETELLRLTVVDSNRFLARDAANALASILVNLRQVVGSRIYVVDYAITPDPITILDYIQFSILGFVTGCILGLIFAFLKENLDPKLYEKEAIKDYIDVDVFGEIPSVWKWRREKFRLDFLGNYDAFRRLRTNLLYQANKNAIRTILISSAQPSEGKSTIIANLALSISQIGHKVVVLDTDFHRPCMHKFFELENDIGLSNLLEDEQPIDEIIKVCKYPGISVITSGTPSPQSNELLGSSRMSSLLEKLRELFDIVLLDTPAFMGISDAAMLAQHVDGIILVARIGFVRGDTLRATYQQLIQGNTLMMGVVVNHIKKTLPSSYRTYYDQGLRSPTHGSTSIPNTHHDSKPSEKVNEIQSQGTETDLMSSPTHDYQADEGDKFKRDQLTKIKGIGFVFERALHTIGINSVTKLAKSNSEEIILKTEGGKVVKQSTVKTWIDQAKLLINQKRDDEK